MRYFTVIAAIGLLAISLSCSHLDGPGPSCGGLLEYDAGDTLIVCIPDSAAAFAGKKEADAYIPNHYSLDAYLFREYRIAKNEEETPAPTVYSGSFQSWKTLSWDVRQAYLPYPYRFDLAGADYAEFLYLIATYPEQFGFGWTDAFIEDPDFDAASTGHIWFNDNPETVQFDGHSAAYEEYVGMVAYLR